MVPYILNVNIFRYLCDEITDIFKSTDLLGTVPLLYEGLMKHMSVGGALPECLMPTLGLFLKLAELDLKLFQVILYGFSQIREATLIRKS